MWLVGMVKRKFMIPNQLKLSFIFFFIRLILPTDDTYLRKGFLLQHQAILGKLHSNLNEDAVLYMYENTLREIPLFENVEYSFFRAFAKNLEEKYFQKGYMVMRSNEVISMMFIIFRGKVSFKR